MRDTTTAAHPLKVLTLHVEDAEPQTPEFNSTGSWQGLAVEPDRKIQRLAKARWADIDDASCPSSATPDSAANVKRPVFPDSVPGADVGRSTTLAPHTVTDDEMVHDDGANDDDVPRVHTGTDDDGRAKHSDHDSKTEGAPAGETEVAPFEPDVVPGLESLPKINFELEGWLPFILYSAEATNTELPTAAQLELETSTPVPRLARKLFFGHLPSALPTGVLQWLLDTLVDRQPHEPRPLAFEPQLHFKEGWFKGCAHALVMAPRVERVISSLHHRVLFDLHGIWYAQTASEMQILQQYCAALRNLPQRQRHEKLQGLPCNPLACELTRNA